MDLVRSVVAACCVSFEEHIEQIADVSATVRSFTVLFSQPSKFQPVARNVVTVHVELELVSSRVGHIRYRFQGQKTMYCITFGLSPKGLLDPEIPLAGDIFRDAWLDHAAMQKQHVRQLLAS